MSIKTKWKLLCILSNINIGIVNLLKIIIYLTELYIKTIVTFIIFIKGRLPIKYLSFRSVINYEGEYMIVEKNKKNC